MLHLEYIQEQDAQLRNEFFSSILGKNDVRLAIKPAAATIIVYARCSPAKRIIFHSTELTAAQSHFALLANVLKRWLQRIGYCGLLYTTEGYCACVCLLLLMCIRGMYL